MHILYMFTNLRSPFQGTAFIVTYLFLLLTTTLCVRCHSSDENPGGGNPWILNNFQSLMDKRQYSGTSSLNAVVMECPNESLERSVESVQSTVSQRCKRRILVKISLLRPTKALVSNYIVFKLLWSTF